MFYMNKVQSTHKTLKEKWQYWARVKKKLHDNLFGEIFQSVWLFLFAA